MIPPWIDRVLLIACVSACDNRGPTTGTADVSAPVALVSSVGGRLFVVRFGADTTLAVGDTVRRLPSPIERTNVADEAILTSSEAFSDRIVSRIDMRSGRELSRKLLSEIEGSNADVGPVTFNFGGNFAASRDTAVMAFADARRRSGERGVGIVNTTTWRLERFLAIENTALTFGRWREQPALFVGGRRPLANGPYAPMVLIYRGDDFTLIDSIPLGTPAVSSSTPVAQLRYVPKVGRIVAMVAGSIVSCAPATPGTSDCARIPSPVLSGDLSVGERDDTLLLMDYGAPGWLGSGAVFLVSADATSIQRIDLPRTSQGDPLAMRGLSADSTRGTWFISIGTTTGRNDFIPQASRLLIYDFKQRRIVHELIPSADVEASRAL